MVITNSIKTLLSIGKEDIDLWYMIVSEGLHEKCHLKKFGMSKSRIEKLIVNTTLIQDNVYRELMFKINRFSGDFFRVLRYFAVNKYLDVTLLDIDSVKLILPSKMFEEHTNLHRFIMSSSITSEPTDMKKVHPLTFTIYTLSPQRRGIETAQMLLNTLMALCMKSLDNVSLYDVEYAIKGFAFLLLRASRIPYIIGDYTSAVWAKPFEKHWITSLFSDTICSELVELAYGRLGIKGTCHSVDELVKKLIRRYEDLKKILKDKVEDKEYVIVELSGQFGLYDTFLFLETCNDNIVMFLYTPLTLLNRMLIKYYMNSCCNSVDYKKLRFLLSSESDPLIARLVLKRLRCEVENKRVIYFVAGPLMHSLIALSEFKNMVEVYQPHRWSV